MHPPPPHWHPSTTATNVIELAAHRPRPRLDVARVLQRYVRAQLRTMRAMLEGGDLYDGSPEHRYVMERLDDLGRVIEVWSERLRETGPGGRGA